MAQKIRKFLIIIVSLTVVAAVALAVLIKIYVTPERIKAFLIPEAEKALNRKVDIAELEIGLFKGIVAKDFVIKEADGKTDFLKCRDFVFKYQLIPILSKRLVIDQISIEEPSVRIVRSRDGKFNFEDIGKKPKSEKTGEKERSEGTGDLPVSLLVSRIAVKDAGFSFTDLKKELPDLKGSFDLDTGIQSSGASGLSSEGRMELRLDEVLLRKETEKQIRDISAELEYAVNIDLGSNMINIGKADMNVLGIPVSLSGGLTDLKASPKVDLTIALPKTKISDIQKAASVFTEIKGLGLSGDLEADMKVTGMPKDIDSLKTDGVVTLEKAGIRYSNVDAVLDGDLKFSKDSVKIALTGTAGKNSADIKGTVNSYLKDQKISLNIYSSRLFLDELIPGGKQTGAPSAEQNDTPKARTSEEAKPLDLKLTAGGEVKIDSAIYKGMTMSDFHMTYVFRNNRLEITEMTADAGKGDFSLDSVIDLSKAGYAYDLSADINSLHAEELINSMFPKAKDTVFGVITSGLKLKGSGTRPGNIRKNLAGNFDFDIKDGKITNVPIAKNLSQLLNIKELETLDIRQGSGTVRIKNGTAALNSIFSSDDVVLDPKGNIGLDGDLDLAFDLKMSPNLTGNAMSSSVSRYIKNDEGWGVIPIKCHGTFEKPKCAPDVAKAGKQAIKKKGRELIEDLFNEKEDTKEDEAPKQQEEKPIENLIKGLFD